MTSRHLQNGLVRYPVSVPSRHGPELGPLHKKKIRQPAQKRLPCVLSHEQIQRLLSAIQSPVYRTFFAFIYACGLRISEAQFITVQDIDGSKGTVRIIGKGNKERLIPLPTPTLISLRALWKTHKHPRLLFPNQNGDQPVAGAYKRLPAINMTTTRGCPARCTFC
ncbi:MAG: tyrosine-type recombinase/integrase, partial [Magnetococcales bacterium]|nr:tyrosine-type recombinase/integrase [Magnetococcales bacterium]